MAKISVDELCNRFGYHPAAKEETAEAHAALRARYLRLANEVVVRLPEGREASLAITHLEESLMWANKAIAMTGPLDVDTPHIPRELPKEH